MSRSNRSRGGAGGVWNAAFLLAVAVGLLCANVQWGLQRWIAAALTVAVMASLVAAAMLADGGVRAIPRMVAWGLVAGFVGSSAAALVTVFDVLGLLVVLVLFATSPAVHAGRCGWRGGRVRCPGPRLAPAPSSRRTTRPGRWPGHRGRAHRAVAGRIADLDDAALCRRGGELRAAALRAVEHRAPRRRRTTPALPRRAPAAAPRRDGQLAVLGCRRRRRPASLPGRAAGAAALSRDRLRPAGRFIQNG